MPRNHACGCYQVGVRLILATGHMRVFNSEPFPPVTIEADSGYWSGDIELSGAMLSMAIYIDSAVADAKLEDAARMLKGLADLRKRGLAAIGTSAASDETTVRDFFQFHLEEVPDSLPEAVRAEATNDAFVGALVLCGVAIHADEDFAFQLVLDFSFGRQHSDELLAVKFSPDGSVRQVSHES